jgi:poly(3-hydroxybutyrate) depolymerase
MRAARHPAQTTSPDRMRSRSRSLVLAGAAAVVISATTVGGTAMTAEAVAFSVPPSPTAAAVPAAVPPLITETIRVGSVTRTFGVQLPTSGTKNLPAIFLYHGMASTDAGLEAISAVGQVAPHDGFALITPQVQAGAPTFNDGRLGPTGPNDDAMFVAVEAALVKAGTINPDRVTVTGMSNGAGMAMEIAARHPNLVAAQVIMAGEFLSQPGSARPTGAVPTVLLHGQADTVQPWAGRKYIRQDLPGYISEPATAAAWVAADRSGAPTSRVLDEGTATQTTVTNWPTRGIGSAPVTLYAFADMGHDWAVTQCPAGFSAVAEPTTPCRTAAQIADQAASFEPVGATAVLVRVAQNAVLGHWPNPTIG